MIDNLISEHDYAAKRGVSVRTVQRERALRTGPPFIRLGRKVYYRLESIEQWLIANEETPVRSKVRGAA